MSNREDLHTRVDYMEKDINSQLARMASSISRMADSIDKLIERNADMSLLIERSNQHSVQINHLDERLDRIEQRMPLIERFMSRADKISITVTIIIVAGVIGSVVKFM